MSDLVRLAVLEPLVDDSEAWAASLGLLQGADRQLLEDLGKEE